MKPLPALVEEFTTHPCKPLLKYGKLHLTQKLFKSQHCKYLASYELWSQFQLNIKIEIAYQILDSYLGTYASVFGLIFVRKYSTKQAVVTGPVNKVNQIYLVVMLS